MDGVAALPPLRETIARHELDARKRFGQHFLLDLNLTRRIARAAAPLDDGTGVERCRGPRDAARQVQVEQEMLPEALAGIEAVGSDGLAQRRQCGDRRDHRLGGQLPRRRAMSSAMASAATRLDGSARPVPAMSSAVP